MSETAYRRGFQDGWFYDETETIDPDYKEGFEEGKKSRKRQDKILQKAYDIYMINEGNKSNE